MARSKNTRLVAHIDCPGGGQVWVDGKTLYIGHMREPTGTTIVDVADPANPVVLARVEVPPGWHSHKVRVANGIMVVNHERQGKGGDPNFGGGLGIYDVSTPARPRAALQVAHPRQRRAPLRFRRPLRLHFADRRGLHRQHHDDSRPQGSERDPRRSGAGGFRGNGRRAARPIPGPTVRRRAAITRCAWATGCT